MSFGPTFADFTCVDALNPYPNGVPLSVAPTMRSASAMGSSGAVAGVGGGSDGDGGGGGVERMGTRGTRGSGDVRWMSSREERGAGGRTRAFHSGEQKSVFVPLLEFFVALFRG